MTPPDDRSPAARALDEALVARTREVFDAHDDPATDAGWARMQAALAAPGTAAADRPAVRRARRWLPRAGVLAAVAAVATALGWYAATRALEQAPVSEMASQQGREAARGPDPESNAAPEALAALTDPSSERLAERSASATSGALPVTGIRPEGVSAARAQRHARATLRQNPVVPEALMAESPVLVAEVPDVVPDSLPTVPVLPLEPPDAPGRPILVVESTPTVQPEISPAAPLREAPRLRLLAVAEAGPVSVGVGIGGSAVSVGVVAEWAARPAFRLGLGPRLAYVRAADAATAAEVVAVLGQGPVIASGGQTSVTTREELSALALELPFEAVFDVARAPGGRVTVGVGAVSAVYLSQTFRDVGLQLTGDGTEVTSTPFETLQSVSAWKRVDVARQLGLSVGYAARDRRIPFSADIFARIPLRGATSRDVALGQVGVRLWVPLGR